MAKKKKTIRIAIAGRRNAGKSSLFNALLGRQRAITDDTPGLTRDVLEAEIRRGSYRFLLSDTPGLDIEKPDELETGVLERARKYLTECDAVILLFEPPGPAEYDHLLIDFFRKHFHRLPVFYVVNKVDTPEREAEDVEGFYEAGLHELTAISVKSRWNLNEMLDRIAARLPEIVQPEESAGADEVESERRVKSTVISDHAETDTTIALVGKPNAGKSSLLNGLSREDIALVSEVPGTTRDTLDTILRYHGKALRLIDTAGIRRSGFLHKEKKKGRPVELFSNARTRRAIRDARVVIQLLDGVAGLSELDKKITNMIFRFRKPAVFAVNKWDVFPDKHDASTREFLDKLYFHFPPARHYPVVFCSAKTGQRIDKLLDTCLDLDRRMRRRVPTAELNERIKTWEAKKGGKDARSKVLYATQVEVEPPVFLLFVNRPEGFRAERLTYLENRLRETYDWKGVPIRLFLRENKEEREG